MAVARGAANPVDHMVICTGLGLVTVHLDAQGNPVGPPHICPDAIVGFFADAGAGSVDFSLSLTVATVRYLKLSHQYRQRVLPDIRMRGPPLAV